MVTSAREKALYKHLPQHRAHTDRYAITGEDQDQALHSAFDDWHGVFVEEHERDPDWKESREAVRSIVTQIPILCGMTELVAMHRLELSKAPAV